MAKKRKNSLTADQYSMKPIMLDILRQQGDKPITAPEIVKELKLRQFPNARETDIRDITRWCRSQMPPILIMSGGHGYYLVKNAEEMDSTIKHLWSRSMSMLRTCSKLRKYRAALLRQKIAEQEEMELCPK